MALPRMRTVKEAVAMIKAEDPDTALTEHALRMLIKTGKVPIVQSGRRFLLNFDRLTAFLSLPTEETGPVTENIPQAGQIRRIEV